MFSRRSTSFSALAATALVAFALTGCAQIVPLQPAADSNNPSCAEVTVSLPDTIAGLKKRETNAQATGAWGDPAAVLLHCGVPTPGPTTDRCVSVNDVDWIIDESEEAEQKFRFTTYGRTPAVEVYINADPETGGVSGVTALSDLSSAVGRIAPETQCLNIEDAITE
ncbi:DUF3515 domain-containing protein [Mycetocola spongiae]|uniref:DUF3515 domain-containing protein n=1 Tax=Mycetocola spongiae TaxID=2859226 RepID=UPI001CF47C44|nr:DUF3515 domain-containing protein [Mycetocola spongiae]UCR89154.1 DUF3515 domain-containing protein [Mycetocola spongiae]